MTKILAIDASTEACSVALLNHSEITSRFQLAPREHAKLLLPMVQELLADSELSLSQLDAVACNVGPGAFTGIRIAVSIAQGLAFGANLAAISLSTLQNLALQGYQLAGKKHWLCAIDARMSEVYLGGYEVNSERLITTNFAEQVISPQLIQFEKLAEQGDLQLAGLIGSGWRAYQESLLTPAKRASGLDPVNLLDECYPNVKYSLFLAEQKFQSSQILQAEALQPVYLRNNVAKKKSVKI